MDDEYRALLLDAYKGELLGEALFGAFAARESGDRAAKLRVLERIEGTTARQLRPLVDAAEDEATIRAQGHEIGNADIGWDAFVTGLHDALPSFLANFVRLRTMAVDAD